jgi:glycine/D-amino acid oxidase-like deaminating enzyme/nitrite reductase/ring-hydroxylating ferredoxin subunit
MADTNSVWSKTRATLSEAASLTQDLSVDVCIVGAGIAGLLTADALLERGLRVAVLERASIGSGQTGLTTAHLTAILDSRYFVLEREHGPEGAALAAESHTAAIAHIEQLSERGAVACEFERVDGYLYAADTSSESELEHEAEAALRAGLHVETVSHIPLPFASGRALKFPRQAQFHPMKLLAGLVRRIEARGGRIFLQTPVDTIETGVPAVVHTQHGHQVRAGAVVVATNTPINSTFAMHTKQAPYRTYAIAAPVPRGALPPGLYWDTEDPYHYVRLARAPEAGLPAESDWIIVGGEDHKVGQSDDPEGGWTKLEQWTRKRLPMVSAPRYRWSGQVYEPADGLGFIGKSPGSDNVFLITGHSGNGMSYGAIAALLLSDLVLGRSHRWQHLYDPTRKPLGRTSLGRFAHENLNVARKYAEWLTPGNVDSVQDIARGEGAVIRRGLKKVAVYVDPSGCAHERSAVCPHLGGVVHWNTAEKSWDCPCHGSRFDAYGHVLVGPAHRDLDGANEPARERVERVERPSHHRS